MAFQRGNRNAKKLTGEQVMEIREKYALPGVTQPMLAREYGVSLPTISNILNYVTWQNPSYEPPPPRPPLQPQVPQSAVEASMVKMQRLLDKGPPLEQAIAETKPIGSWYDQPPSEVPGQEPTGIGMARFEKEAAKLQPQVGKELEKLEKGD